MKIKTMTASLILAGVVLAACTKQEPPAPAQAPAPPVAFKPTATIQDIMLAIIDPNIDPVWNSVSTVVTAKGTEERRPTTDEDWKVLRQHALTVAEAGNLLLIEGREVAKAGASTSIHPVELSPPEIKVLIAAQRSDFTQRAHALHDASLALIAAIDAKDVGALEKAGGLVEHACEQCHSQFWYPGDKRPTAQLELGVQQGSDLYRKLRAADIPAQQGV